MKKAFYIFIGILLICFAWLGFLSVQTVFVRNLARAIFVIAFIGYLGYLLWQKSIFSKKTKIFHIILKLAYVLPVLIPFSFEYRVFLILLSLLIFILFAVKIIANVWVQKLLSKRILYGILYCFGILLWCIVGSYLGLMIKMLSISSHYCDFVYDAQLESENGKVLDLSLGTIEKLSGGGFQDGRCNAVISYKNNSDYAIQSIKDMGGQISAHCEGLSNDCLFYHRDQNGAEIDTLIYDFQNNKLYYNYENN